MVLLPLGVRLTEVRGEPNAQVISHPSVVLHLHPHSESCVLTASQTLSLTEMAFSRVPAFSVLVPLDPVPTGCDTEKARRHMDCTRGKDP